MALIRTTTRYGIAEGVERNGIATFRGIPYATPPVGALRWKRPVPLPEKKWDGVRVFDTFGSICPQKPPEHYLRDAAPIYMSEDCLYLNIWTPAETASDRLPVMVWIHGGAFMFGSQNSKLYFAESLCRKGIVVVHIAYRMNWFGFFSHPDLDAENAEHVSGNYGLWDEVEALKWVRDNIADFGGDPGRVTIAGQSAGGASVAALLAFPAAEGLFSAGIIESGVHDTDKLSCTLEEAERILHEFLERKGYGDYSAAQLRELPAETLLELDIPTWFDGIAPLRPVVDGYVQPQQSYDMFRLAKIHDVPLIFGTNGYEGNMGPRDCDYKTFMDFIRGYAGEDCDKFLTVYPITEESFETLKHIVGRDKEFANLHFLASRLCESRKSPVYHYHFAQGNLQKDGAVLMPTHARELYYVWDHLEMQPGDPEIKDKHKSLADKIGSYWTNFVKTGNPNGEGLPEWPAYSEACDKHLRIEAEQLGAYTSHYPIGTDLIEKMMKRAELSR